MPLTVAVSGINSMENPGSGIGVIRSLLESGSDYHCIGLAYDAMEPGLYLDEFVSHAYLLPYPSSDAQKYLDRLLTICRDATVDALIPVFDSELPHYISSRSRIEEEGLRILLPSRDQYDSVRKSALPELAEQIGVPVPRSIAVTSYEELSTALESLGFPAVVKGVFYEAYPVHSHQEAREYFDKIVAKWGYPVILQQFIRGDDFNLIGCCGKHGRILGLVAIKKLLTTQMGKTWSAVTIANDAILEAGRRFARELEWEGGFELEFRITPEEEIYLLEINPRFPAWIYLATAAGINLPDRYIKHLFEGKEDFPEEYEVGKLLVRYTGERIRSIGDFERIVVHGEKKP
ncbi:MAG: carboxylate--amine ligase [Candidatus Hydrogenedentota bacterium]|nr:MAG: carboxylate--amine ligase [Candidatus Hydrogenedentota bacterium]